MTYDRTSWVAFDHRGFPIAFALAEWCDENEFRDDYGNDARIELCDHDHVGRLLAIHAGDVASAGTQGQLPL